METARLIVERGGTVIIFPEGTRIRTGSLGRPEARRRPAGARDGRRRAPGRRPGLRAGAPRLAHPPAQGPAARRDAADLPAHRAPVAGARGDRHRPDLAEHRAAVGVARRAAAAAQGGGRSGAGSWGTAVAVLLARGGLEVELGTRSEEKARQIARKGENEEYLPGVKLPEGVTRQAHERDRARRLRPDLPRGALVGAAERRRLARPTGSARAPRCCCSRKGFVQPMGALPNEYVSERVRARAIASLGGPAHAREAAAGMAALVLGSADPDLRADARRGLRPRRPGLRAHRRRHRGRDRRRGQERGRARRRGRRALRAQRGGDRRRRRLARVRRVRARQGRRGWRRSPGSPGSAT